AGQVPARVYGVPGGESRPMGLIRWTRIWSLRGLVRRGCVGIITGLLAVSFGLVACSADVSVESAGVFTSPGRSAELIVTRSNYGATVPYVYRFYVKQPESELEEKLEVLRTDSFEGMQVEWS